MPASPTNPVHRFYNDSADYPHDWSKESIIGSLLRVRVNWSAAGKIAAGWGGRRRSASSMARARDKQQARAFVAATDQVIKNWSKLGDQREPLVPSMTLPELRAFAAGIDWDEWIDDEIIPALIIDASNVVSWAIDEGDKRFANQAAWRFHSELHCLRLITER